MARRGAGDAGLAGEADEGGAFAEGDAVAGVEVAEVVGGGGGGDAGEDARRGFDEGDVEALLAEDGGGFEADVAAADDERAAPAARVAASASASARPRMRRTPSRAPPISAGRRRGVLPVVSARRS